MEELANLDGQKPWTIGIFIGIFVLILLGSIVYFFHRKGFFFKPKKSAKNLLLTSLKELEITNKDLNNKDFSSLICSSFRTYLTEMFQLKIICQTHQEILNSSMNNTPLSDSLKIEILNWLGKLNEKKYTVLSANDGHWKAQIIQEALEFENRVSHELKTST